MNSIVIKWPPQSPDLILKEDLWDVVEHEILIHVQPLRNFIMSICTKIQKEFFQHLVESVPGSQMVVQPGISKV